MASCSICGNEIPAADVVSGRYRKRDGQTVCLKCDGVSVPRPAATAKAPAPAKPATVAAAAAKPAARPSSGNAGGASSGARHRDPGTEKPKTPRSQHYAPQGGGGMDNLTRNAMIVAGAILVIAAVVIFIIRSKHVEEANIKHEIEQQSLEAVEKPKKYFEANPMGFDETLTQIDASRKDVIPGGKDEAELLRLESEVKNKKLNFETRKRNLDMLAKVEQDADNVEKIDETVKNVESLVEAAGSMEDDFRKKVNDLSLKIHTNAVKAVDDSIKRFQKENPKDFKGILERYRQGSVKLEDMKKQGGEVGKLAHAKGKELRAEEEDFSVQYYNSVQDKTPWINLLDDAHVGKWTKSGPVEISFAGGKMIAKSTTGPGTKERGTLLAGKKDYWIDFDVEMDVEIKSAGFVILGRYSGPQNFFQLTCETGGENNPIKDGTRYKISVKSVGRQADIFVEGPEGKIDLAAPSFTIPAVARSGALGFGINPGGEMIFHSIRARVVRAD